jgi:hypothetical protein
MLPVIVLAVLAFDRWRPSTIARGGPAAFDPRKIVTLAVLAMMVNVFLLKRLGYEADHFDLAVVMLAWLFAWLRARGARGGRPRRLAMSLGGVSLGGVSLGGVSLGGVSLGGVSLILGLTLAASAVVSANLPAAAQRNRLLGTTLPEIWRFSAEKFDSFATSPPIDAFALADDTGDRAVVRYLYECTRPDDRLLLLTDSYPVPYYAGRPIVGHIFWEWGFMATPAFERQTIDVLEQGRVPVVLSLAGDQALDMLRWYPELREYISRQYTRTFSLPREDDPSNRIWVLTDRRREPTGRSERLNLPCFT